MQQMRRGRRGEQSPTEESRTQGLRRPVVATTDQEEEKEEEEKRGRNASTWPRWRQKPALRTRTSSSESCGRHPSVLLSDQPGLTEVNRYFMMRACRTARSATREQLVTTCTCIEIHLTITGCFAQAFCTTSSCGSHHQLLDIIGCAPQASSFSSSYPLRLLLLPPPPPPAQDLLPQVSTRTSYYDLYLRALRNTL
jgi:hypothetical protein